MTFLELRVEPSSAGPRFNCAAVFATCSNRLRYWRNLDSAQMRNDSKAEAVCCLSLAACSTALYKAQKRTKMQR